MCLIRVLTHRGSQMSIENKHEENEHETKQNAQQAGFSSLGEQKAEKKRKQRNEKGGEIYEKRIVKEKKGRQRRLQQIGEITHHSATQSVSQLAHAS